MSEVFLEQCRALEAIQVGNGQVENIPRFTERYCSSASTPCPPARSPFPPGGSALISIFLCIGASSTTSIGIAMLQDPEIKVIAWDGYIDSRG